MVDVNGEYPGGGDPPDSDGTESDGQTSSCGNSIYYCSPTNSSYDGWVKSEEYLPNIDKEEYYAQQDSDRNSLNQRVYDSLFSEVRVQVAMPLNLDNYFEEGLFETWEGYAPNDRYFGVSDGTVYLGETDGRLRLPIALDGTIDINAEPLNPTYQANPGLVRVLSLLSRGRAVNLALARNSEVIRNTVAAKELAKFYRPNSSIGGGGSSSALIKEVMTGQPVGSVSGHAQKVAESRNKFIELLRGDHGVLGYQERQFVAYSLRESNLALRQLFSKGSNYPYEKVNSQTMRVLDKYNNNF